MTPHNIFSALPKAAPGEIIESILKTDQFTLKRIISTGQATPPEEWYDQDDDEWCILLSGSAGLRFADEAQVVVLKAGDYLHIPAHKRHQVAWTEADQPTVWLALHYPPGK